MQFTTKTVRCSTPGLTQEAALDTLYDRYGSGIRVSSIRQRGDFWVATIKVAEFPPKEDGGGAPSPEDSSGEDSSDGPDDSGSDSESDSGSEEGSEKPSGPPGEGGKEKGHGGVEHQILGLLHEIAQALGVAGPMGHDTMMPGDEPMPPGHPGPGGPPSPDAQPPGGGPAPARRPTKLKPGEVLPTQTPIGSPAFSSAIHTANGCPTCGGALGPDGGCATCGQSYAPGPGGAPAAAGAGGMPAAGGMPVVGKVATFTASQVTNASLKEAKSELEREYGQFGYRVKQIVAGTTGDGQRELRALLSVR